MGFMQRYTALFPSACRCGIALDCWMLPVHRDLCDSGTQQPLLFINSQRHVLHRVKNLESMLKMAKPPDETGVSRCQILTLMYASKFNTRFVAVVLTQVLSKGCMLSNLSSCFAGVHIILTKLTCRLCYLTGFGQSSGLGWIQLWLILSTWRYATTF